MLSLGGESNNPFFLEKVTRGVRLVGALPQYTMTFFFGIGKTWGSSRRQISNGDMRVWQRFQIYDDNSIFEEREE